MKYNTAQRNAGERYYGGRSGTPGRFEPGVRTVSGRAADCGCKPRGSCGIRECGCLNELPAAMAYVPLQSFGGLYEPSKALCRGTVFAQLDLPFSGKGCAR